MMDILAKALKAGIRLHAEGEELRVTAPQGALTPEIREGLKQNKQAILDYLLNKNEEKEAKTFFLTPDLMQKYDPFPLTEMQHAYWFGRDSSMEMGGVGTHFYVELDCEPLDVSRLNHALRHMIDHHDMLRAIVEGNGMQRILPNVPRYEITVNDQSSATEEEAEQAISNVRTELSHQVFQADQWPLFEIRVTRLPNARARLHVSLDLLIFDLWSMFLFFRELHELYENPTRKLPSIDLSFRDYVLAERSLQKESKYQKQYNYWMSQIKTLPAAPDLPLKTDLAARKNPRFTQREVFIDKVRWNKLREQSLAKGITPSILLLTAFSEVIAYWSASSHFTLNMTVSNRLPLHEDVNKLLGDFTSSILQEVDRRDPDMTFLELAQQLQKKFSNNMENREVSGVTVLREWAKMYGVSLHAAMPVVFTSGLVRTGDEEANVEQFGKKVYSISQTPQVWLDHHVMEYNGELNLIWVTADDVFEQGVLDAMFSAYHDLVERLADEPSIWNESNVMVLPADMSLKKLQNNRLDDEQPKSRLHAGFVEQALKNPDSLAVITPNRKMTYRELLAESCAVARWLTEQGIGSGEPVAVLMNKGWEQIVAVYGILLAGGAYMPLNANLPTKRQQDLLRIGEVTSVLTQPGVIREDVQTDDHKILEIVAGTKDELSSSYKDLLQSNLDELAYVIFTSGTTGEPKGVMISHRGAMNTILHMNQLFALDASDSVLGVSSLSFDLSVYDIFGLHSVGGTLVLPDYQKEFDPMHWRQLMSEFNVTIWNSAPQLMSMLMDSYSRCEQDKIPLKTVLLGGDFIPLHLPERIKSTYAGVRVISLGGATEASIWSIYYPIEEVKATWSSIPYGKALPNQSMWVYDSAFRLRPDYVKGRIFIGGFGLAQGYWKDEEKTASKFITHPVTGERLYDTGDLGMYAPDGNIIILGRDDNQIKIRGYRVELGEIEAVLQKHPAIKQSVVISTKGQEEVLQLVAYIVQNEDKIPFSIAAKEIQDFLSERLPDYMVPRHVIKVQQIPLTGNGKVDHKALLSLTDFTTEDKVNRVLPRNDVEEIIFQCWSSVITKSEISVTDNFFDLGGDSIAAVQLVQSLNNKLPLLKLEMHELFENLTIESLALLYQRRTDTNATNEETSDQAATETPLVDREAMVADVHSALQEIEQLDYRLRERGTITEPKTVLLTGATGWIGAHVLSEILTKTDAKVICLVREFRSNIAQQFIEKMHDFGADVLSTWINRLEVMEGDIAKPTFGLDAVDWKRLTEEVDTIYHLAASVNVLLEYKEHRATNVGSVVTAIKLATEHHLKPIFVVSPMAVCRRNKNGQLVVLHEEKNHPDPDGLLTGYSQSKWAAEQILMAAVERGLPVKIYRTSHALPSARTGIFKPSDTYGSVIEAAYEAGVVPDWKDSAFYGVPVDILSKLMVENSLLGDDYSGVIHLENKDPLHFTAILQQLLKLKSGQDNQVLASLESWKNSCLQAALRLTGESSQLASVLFATRGQRSAVENMFTPYSVDTTYYGHRNEESKLSNLTSEAYWQKLYQNLETKKGEATTNVIYK